MFVPNNSQNPPSLFSVHTLKDADAVHKRSAKWLEAVLAVHPIQGGAVA